MKVDKINRITGGKRSKPQDAKKAWRGLRHELAAIRKQLLLLIAISICTSFLFVYTPWKLGQITDLLYNGITGSGINFTKFYREILLLSLLYISAFLLNMRKRIIVVKAIQKLAVTLRMKIGRKINRLPLKFFDQQQKGDVLSRVTNDVDMINSSLQQCISQLINAVLIIVQVSVAMFLIHPLLASIVIFVLPASLFFVKSLLGRSQKLYRKQQAATGALNGYIEEAYAANIIIKTFGGSDIIKQEFYDKNNTLCESACKAQTLSGFFSPITDFISNICFILICVFGGIFIINGRISLGQMQTMTQYARRFAHPVSEIASFANIIQSTLAAYERIEFFLTEEEQPADALDAVAPAHIEGAIEFKNVCFGYDEQPVLKNISFKIEPGQKVALVGNTGSGKSTLMKLLLRFYDIQSGSISLDGIDIKTLQQQRLHQAFGMVLQDIWLSDAMIKENIAYAASDYTIDDVQDAAKSAYAHRFISMLPSGYNYVLQNSGEEFSQGQKQLLTIARAIFKKPEILLLDEATSSVDARTELLIQRIMAKFMGGKTSIVIAHRLSTITASDLILVLKDGEIVEQGKHEELLLAEGYYYQLYESQFADCL